MIAFITYTIIFLQIKKEEEQPLAAVKRLSGNQVNSHTIDLLPVAIWSGVVIRGNKI